MYEAPLYGHPERPGYLDRAGQKKSRDAVRR
jgi:hypothetical protein